LEIATLEKQKAFLARALVSGKPAEHLSKAVAHHAKQSTESQTEMMINKLKAQKLKLMRELSLYHASSNPSPSNLMQTPPVIPATVLAQSQMPPVNPATAVAQSQKRAQDLKRLLRKQDALQEKIDQYDQQDDPVVQSVMAEHFTKNPVRESNQFGFLCACSFYDCCLGSSSNRCRVCLAASTSQLRTC
jgi:hypothetical protein